MKSSILSFRVVSLPERFFVNSENKTCREKLTRSVDKQNRVILNTIAILTEECVRKGVMTTDPKEIKYF